MLGTNHPLFLCLSSVMNTTIVEQFLLRLIESTQKHQKIGETYIRRQSLSLLDLFVELSNALRVEIR